MAAVQVMIHDRPDRLAISAPIACNYPWDHHEEIKVTTARVNSRCQDLLAVVGPASPKNDLPFASQLHRIEFLHRSVRDFLNGSESVQRRLDGYAGEAIFDAHLALLACYVFFVKRASKWDKHSDIHIEELQQAAIVWCAEALRHIRELPARPSTMSLLDALDEGMRVLYSRLGTFHWSNYLFERPMSYQTPPKFHDLDVIERGGRDLLGHLIEIGLISHVEALLKLDPSLLRAKKGRPYLDYALRYERRPGFGSIHRFTTHPDFAMVELLLNSGCEVNEVVQTHGNRTVWDSYIYYAFSLGMNDEYHRKITWLLINHGATQSENRIASALGNAYPRSLKHDDAEEVKLTKHPRMLSMVESLVQLFGASEAEAMQQHMLRNDRDRSWKAIFPWLGPRRPLVSKATHYTWDQGTIRASNLQFARSSNILETPR